MDIKQIYSIKKNPEFVLRIVKSIETEIHRSINHEEENLVISVVKNLPNRYFSEYSIDAIVIIIKNIIIEEFAITQCEINTVDTHEILKHTIDTNIKNETPKNISTLVKKINDPISSVHTAYLLLDSKYRILENDGTEYFSWGYMNQLTISQGTVNSLGNIRDIISMVLMSYKIPNVSSADNVYDLVTLSIEEFISQSTIAHNGRRYHFMGCVERNKSTAQWLSICSDDFHKGEYKFNKPITSLDKITIKFGSPIEPIIFDKDRLHGIITYGSPTIFNFTENHNLMTNDIVYIDTFNTNNRSFDCFVINNINNKNGQPATVLSTTSISIPVNSSSIITTLTGTVTTPIMILLGTITVINKKKYDYWFRYNVYY